MTLINLVIKILGPVHERNLTVIMLIIQVWRWPAAHVLQDLWWKSLDLLLSVSSAGVGQRSGFWDTLSSGATLLWCLDGSQRNGKKQAHWENFICCETIGGLLVHLFLIGLCCCSAIDSSTSRHIRVSHKDLHWVTVKNNALAYPSEKYIFILFKDSSVSGDNFVQSS